MALAKKRAGLTPRKVSVRPVTSDNWEDLVRLFETKGSPHYCWCMTYRASAARNLSNSAKKNQLEAHVEDGTPVGVLAYDAEEPIGWCSVAPRETYIRLEKSRTMPRVTPPAISTWTILCFFVSRPHRGQGVANALLEGALAYASKRGAKVVEAYPFDTAGVSSTHRGHSRIFKTAGFEQEGKRWTRSV